MKFICTELQFPKDGRRKATLMTKDKEFCKSLINPNLSLINPNLLSEIHLIDVEKVKEAIDNTKPGVALELKRLIKKELELQ